MGYQRYTTDFKLACLKRYFTPPTKPVRDLSAELGVPFSVQPGRLRRDREDVGMASMTEYQRLVQNLRRLGLSKVEEYLPGYIDSGEASRKPLAEALLELTDQEIRFRDERAADMNFKLSNFPARKTLASFDFAYQPGLDKARVADLGTLRFVEEGSNVVLIGPPGVGKTHIVIHHRKMRAKRQIKFKGRPGEGRFLKLI